MRRPHTLAAATFATLATLLVGPPTSARADAFDPRDLDKQAHLAVSYGLTFTIAVVARHHDVPRWQAVAIAAATTLVLGTTKELVDDTGYSWGDQLANTIGTATAAIVVFSFEL
ncbi:MAG: YfiM family protein [Myxococcota bacterium]|nr:YfiM family protein [Myxococcota bacterium]